MKDKRTDLKLCFNYTAGWLFAIICLICFLQVMRKGHKEQRWLLIHYSFQLLKGYFQKEVILGLQEAGVGRAKTLEPSKRSILPLVVLRWLLSSHHLSCSRGGKKGGGHLPSYLFWKGKCLSQKHLLSRTLPKSHWPKPIYIVTSGQSQIKKDRITTIGLDQQRSANFFRKEPHSSYFRLSTHSVSYNTKLCCSARAATDDAYTNWVWLCSSKTLFTKTGGGWGLVHKP